MRGPQLRGRTDAELVQGSLAGSDGAFGELVRRYQDLLYRHAERMTGRPDEAEDVVQAAFIKAHRQLASCRDPERVGAWMFRICANACKDHIKLRRSGGVALDEVPGLAGDDDGPDRALARSDLRREIEAALRRLADDQREAFLMKHVEGLSYDEMAEILDASVPALKMRVHRAREVLQVLLEDAS
jgi:RNA polymerase sigma-70 factor (ECF subfamily)